MTVLTVIGLQWGDEGKGKIVDIAAGEADLIVRFQGGSNAGHTVVTGKRTFKLSQLPSGILRPGKFAVIGNGVVLDPAGLIREIRSMNDAGIDVTPGNLAIDSNVSLILPLHRELDGLRESHAGKSRIGTTGKGIGPAYEDKIGRRAIRVGDLDFPERLEEMTDRLLQHHDCLRAGMGAGPVDRNELSGLLASYRDELMPFRSSAPRILHDALATGRKILFEGAQGTFLDIDHGTYPFVTSSTTIAGGAASGSGMPPGRLGYTLGIVKAYATRVGAGPFPTEQVNATGETLGRMGNEFGTVTGRPRRCGWLDIVQLRTACKLSGVDALALMKLDVLDTLDEIRICTRYRIGGREIREWPDNADIMRGVEPVYESCPGWQVPTAGKSSRSELPDAAIRYVGRIEELSGCPVRFISTSPDRSHLIDCHDTPVFR